MMTKAIQSPFSLDLHWPTQNPFLFCAHHNDDYPEGTPQLGVAPEQLKGRSIGNDFTPRDGFRMYHGDVVPGFPVHPHRGFETVTVVLKGMIDHSDSHGSAGRYGGGDVQWMTAGRGLQHAEMFPLLHQDQPNPGELFQIWLNLPAEKKMCEPHYKMLWSEEVPVWKSSDESIQVRIIAGSFAGLDALEPAPDSWAADKANRVRILVMRLKAGQTIRLDAVNETISRNLYFYQGDQVSVVTGDLSETQHLKLNQGVSLTGSIDFDMKNTGATEAYLLVLEGEAILEPVVQYGPFVMNSQAEISQAFSDFRQTQFGGWPWDRPDPVHGSELKRFARYADGTTENR